MFLEWKDTPSTFDRLMRMSHKLHPQTHLQSVCFSTTDLCLVFIKL